MEYRNQLANLQEQGLFEGPLPNITKPGDLNDQILKRQTQLGGIREQLQTEAVLSDETLRTELQSREQSINDEITRLQGIGGLAQFQQFEQRIAREGPLRGTEMGILREEFPAFAGQEDLILGTEIQQQRLEEELFFEQFDSGQLNSALGAAQGGSFDGYVNLITPSINNATTREGAVR